jgi:hypothetical protein
MDIKQLKELEASNREYMVSMGNRYKLFFWKFVVLLSMLNGALCALGYTISILSFARLNGLSVDVMQLLQSEFKVGVALAAIVAGVTMFVGVTCVNGGAAAQREYEEILQCIDNHI